jgi:hypothetical protein
MPHGAKGPVSGVSTPSLIGLGAADSLNPPYALDPPSTAANIATAPAAAVNLYRFTLTPSVMPGNDKTGSDETLSPTEPVSDYLDPAPVLSISPTSTRSGC